MTIYKKVRLFQGLHLFWILNRVPVQNYILISDKENCQIFPQGRCKLNNPTPSISLEIRCWEILTFSRTWFKGWRSLGFRSNRWKKGITLGNRWQLTDYYRKKESFIIGTKPLLFRIGVSIQVCTEGKLISKGTFHSLSYSKKPKFSHFFALVSKMGQIKKNI